MGILKIWQFYGKYIALYNLCTRERCVRDKIRCIQVTATSIDCNVQRVLTAMSDGN